MVLLVRIALSGVERLVLGGDEVHGDAFLRVRADELDEVARQRLQVAGVDAASAERVVGLHPRRRAPGQRHHAGLWVEREGLPQHGQDVGAVVVDREVVEVGIRLARRHVVVGIVREREVARSHRLAQEAQPDAALAKEVAHQRLALPRRQLRAHQPGRRVGERGSEAVHLLIADGVVDADRERQLGLGREASRRLRLKELRLVVVGLHDRDGLGRRGCPTGQQEGGRGEARGEEGGGLSPAAPGQHTEGGRNGTGRHRGLLPSVS